LDCIFDLLNTTQRVRTKGSGSCELLLDCIFDLLNTTASHIVLFWLLLWIAFGLYLWLTEHNIISVLPTPTPVVNCFWIVSLTYWTQQLTVERKIRMGCELLLDCIFDLLNTTSLQVCSTKAMLWIAFGLYLWLTEHNFAGRKQTAKELWIAFGLYLWLTEHNFIYVDGISSCVVNCFWIVSLTYWTQQDKKNRFQSKCCELLLDCIFDLLNTTSRCSPINCIELWIAFGLYLWLTEHNPCH